MTLKEEISSWGPGRTHILNELCTRMIARKVIRPGDTVVDLGANAGFHTGDFVKCVGGGGLVHMFEPNPELWANLLMFSNTRLWPVAVGDSISVETFYLPADQHQNQVGSLVDPSDFIGPVNMNVLSVPQVTLDSLTEISKRRVSFMKVDIERREYHCLKGGQELLRRDSPVIVYENNTPRIQALLEAAGYVICGLVAGETPDCMANCLAVKNGQSMTIEDICVTLPELATIREELSVNYSGLD